MTTETIFLKHGRQRNMDIASFGVVYADEGRDGGPPEVLLAVEADGEHDFTLHPGDTFPVRDQVWKLDRVEDPGSRDWVVVLSRVE